MKKLTLKQKREMIDTLEPGLLYSFRGERWAEVYDALKPSQLWYLNRLLKTGRMLTPCTDDRFAEFDLGNLQRARENYAAKHAWKTLHLGAEPVEVVELPVGFGDAQ